MRNAGGQIENLIGSIAVVVELSGFAEVIDHICFVHGWAYEVIQRSDLEAASLGRWKLVVIASASGPQELAHMSAVAARNPQTCLIVVGQYREPQVIADILHAGADDYLSAPFNPSELAARMMALLSHAGQSARTPARDIKLDYSARTIRSGHIAVRFSQREWTVLMVLLERNGDPVSVEQISQVVWGSVEHQAAAISTIHRIRARLIQAGIRADVVSTHRKDGYSFAMQHQSTAR